MEQEPNERKEGLRQVAVGFEAIECKANEFPPRIAGIAAINAMDAFNAKRAAGSFVGINLRGTTGLVIFQFGTCVVVREGDLEDPPNAAAFLAATFVLLGRPAESAEQAAARAAGTQMACWAKFGARDPLIRRALRQSIAKLCRGDGLQLRLDGYWSRETCQASVVRWADAPDTFTASAIANRDMVGAAALAAARSRLSDILDPVVVGLVLYDPPRA